MRARTCGLSATLLSALCAGCSLGGDVDHGGEHTFLPGARVIDTTPYPLQQMLVVEDDAQARRAYVYLYSGELGKGNVGLPDLRRVVMQSRGFQMAFETPRARYADRPVESAGVPLPLRAGDAARELARLDGASLASTGASRFAGSVTSGDYRLAAWFATFPYEERLGELRVELPGGEELAFDPALSALDVTASIDDEDVLHVDARTADGEAPEADYLVFDLWQPITRGGEGDADAGTDPDADAGTAPPAAETEAIVRALLAADGTYTASASLVTDAAGKGCWSQAQPLRVRVAQHHRRYVPRADGDLAVVHRRLDGASVPAKAWTRLLSEPMRADYCKGYE